MIFVLAPDYGPADDIGAKARWVASLNARCLRDTGCPVAEAQHVAGPAEGAAFFGHGVRGYPLGPAGASALPEQELRHLRDGWLHVFACSTADQFGQAAIAAGVRRFVGYSNRIDPDWDEPDMPPTLRPLVEQLLTCVTVALALGADQSARDRLAEAVDAIVEWHLDNSGRAGANFNDLAVGLLDGFRLYPPP